MALLSGLGKYTSFGLLVMRFGLGVMMIMHGYPKLTGGPEKWIKVGKAMGNLGVSIYPVFWGFMAAATETLGGLLIILGLVYRPVCFLLAFTMVVATLSHFQRGDELMRASHAIELAFVYFGMLFIGPGKYSVDKG